MTISDYSSAIVDTMLGWLKGFANWVLRLFHLAGSVSNSPLLWLSKNWLHLLILFLIIGVGADILIWLVRWRPHWVWFKKERVIVDDDAFFANADEILNDDADGYLDKNWQEQNFVVASTVVKRRGRNDSRDRSVIRTASSKNSGGSLSSSGERTSFSGRQESNQRNEHRRKSVHSRDESHAAHKEAEEKRRLRQAERESVLHSISRSGDQTDYYEDEVFNVSSLPETDEYIDEDSE